VATGLLHTFSAARLGCPASPEAALRRQYRLLALVSSAETSVARR
jgi:hypothetical protein